MVHSVPVIHRTIYRRRGDFIRPAGYVDDNTHLTVGKTLEETTVGAQKAVDEAIAWGAENGITFSLEKIEIQYFSRQQQCISPTIRHGEREVTAQPAIRWLGIWFDP